MSRPLRIEYPGAWYHVSNRGRQSASVFSDTHDYLMFIDLVIEISEKCNVRISARGLMTNHNHILLQTPDGNISKGNGVKSTFDPCKINVICCSKSPPLRIEYPGA
jgi:putative transposase